jgi:MFS family permease
LRPRLTPTFLIGTGQTIVSGAIAPLVPLYAVSMGASPTLVGVVAASNAMLPLMLGVWAGTAVDALGSRRLSIAGSAVLVVAVGVLAAARSIGWLIVGQALAGLAGTMLIVSCQTSVAQASTDENRDRNFGFFAFWVSVGQMIGPLIGGFVADGFSFPAAFAVCAVLGAAPGMIALRMAPLPELSHTFDPVVQALRDRNAYQAGWRLARRRDLRFLMLVTFIIIFAWSIRASFYPLYLESVGLSKASIGLIYSFLGGSSMVVRPLIGTIAERLGKRNILMLALALATFGIGVTPLLHTIWPLAIAVSTTGVAFGFTQPLTMSMMAGSVNPRERGLALSLRMTSNRFAEVVSPVLFGAAVALAGLGSAFYLSAAVLAAGIWAISRGAIDAVAARPPGPQIDTAVPTPPAPQIVEPPARPSPAPPDRG